MIKDVLNTSPGKNKTIKNIKIALEHFFKRNKNKKHHTILLASLSLYVALFTIDICEFFEERSYVLGDIVYKTFNKSGEEEEEELKITATSTSGIPKVRRKKTKKKRMGTQIITRNMRSRYSESWKRPFQITLHLISWEWSAWIDK